jgi:predicted nucleotidyltransferase/biotin operon repressor
MLIDIFIKSPEQKILSLFAMNSDRSFYGREISRKLKISLGGVHGALKSLEKSGILTVQNVGKTKLYRLESFPSIIKTFRILNTLLILEPLINEVKDLSRLVILYGSYSNGTFIAESDLDLFVVSEEREKIMIKIEDLKRKINLDIRPIIKSQVEWITLEKVNPEFLHELNHGIILWEKPIDESGF